MLARFSFSELLSSVVRMGRLSRQLGVGPALAVEMALRKRHVSDAGGIARLNLPDYPAPFYIRAGTSDAEILWQVILQAEYDIRRFPQFEKIDRLYRAATAAGSRPVIIDCGANIGLSAVWFARQFPDAQIFAVEPADDNLAVARRNVSAYPNITVLRGAMWDRSSELTIRDTTAAAWAYQVTESDAPSGGGDAATLKAFTVPEILDLAGADRALIVKIDIEGAEATLFRSNTEWVRSTDLIAIELHDWMLPGRRTSAPFLRSFVNLEFDMLQHGENLFVFIDRSEAERDDLLSAPDGAEFDVRSRGVAAPVNSFSES